MMKACWHREPHERGTFEEIENQLTTMLAGEFQDLPCHRYYQFVPIRDTEIGGVIKDCGLRDESCVIVERSAMQNYDINLDDEGNEMPQRRRFSF